MSSKQTSKQKQTIKDQKSLLKKKTIVFLFDFILF